MTKLTDHLVNLELSRKLHEIGVRKESIYYWSKLSIQKDYQLEQRVPMLTGEVILSACSEYIPAYLVSELGEMMPYIIQIKNDQLYLTMDCDRMPFYESMDRGTELYSPYCNDDDNECDYRAKLLIYLIEEKIVKAEDLK